MEHDGLFVYGSLRFPEVLEVLLGRVPDITPATASGWRVRVLAGVVYPGMVPDPSGVADGVLITGLTSEETALLDAFEDDGYEPRVVPLDDATPARAYIWNGPTEPRDWDAARFAERELPAFAQSCREWRRAYGGAG